VPKDASGDTPDSSSYFWDGTLEDGCLVEEVRQKVREAEAKDSEAQREWLRLEMEKLGIIYKGFD
jgi:hypothetical protein